MHALARYPERDFGERPRMNKIALDEKFAKFSEHWRPKVVAALNGQEVKLVKVQGVFPWHRHAAAEEMFLVWRGTFRVEYRDRVVTLGRESSPSCRAASSIARRPTKRPKSSSSNRRRS